MLALGQNGGIVGVILVELSIEIMALPPAKEDEKGLTLCRLSGWCLNVHITVYMDSHDRALTHESEYSCSSVG